MSTAGMSAELEAIIRQVGDPGSPEYQNLRSAIVKSPVLWTQMETAVARGDLKHFAFWPQNEFFGAVYDSDTQTIHLKQQSLIDPNGQYTLTFILGHELQHGLNRHKETDSFQQFIDQTKAVLESDQPVHNYTPAIHKRFEYIRWDEGDSHIAGWNAFASRVKHDNPAATLAQAVEIAKNNNMGYAGDFIIETQIAGRTELSTKPGFTLNADLSITENARNIEAASKHYFDLSPEQIKAGGRGNSDYRNKYGAYMVSHICQLEIDNPTKAGKLVLDMRGENLREYLLEQNGISLGDSVPDGTRCAYYDTNSPDIERYFDHTIDTNQFMPIRSLPERDEPALTQPAQRELSAQEKQWDQMLDKLIAPKLRESGYSDQQIDNIKAASMVSMAKHYSDRDMAFVGINPERGMVVMAQEGKGYFVPTVTMENAKDMPAQQSLELLDRQLEQQQQQALNPSHGHSGPSLSR